jgi:catechol 2,3-dioxygenase-like lactoylglutathione lyase family enzyme
VPELSYGRLLDHVTSRGADLEASKQLYVAVPESLGRVLRGEGSGFVWNDELFVVQDGEPTSRMHVAFQARDREAVDRFHEAALAAGGRDNGEPGVREYHAAYYAAYALDPDGNNVEAIHRGETKRSADAVVFEPLEW